jgi:hypothetical protein
MTGYPEFNYPLFNTVGTLLRAAGLDVFNPAEYDGAGGILDTTGMSGTERPSETGFDLRAAFCAYTRFITTEADAVAVLPGWRCSPGSRAEVALARAIGLIVFDALTGQLLAESVPSTSSASLDPEPTRGTESQPPMEPASEAAEICSTGRLIDFERGLAQHGGDTALPAPALREPAVPRDRIEVRTTSASGGMKAMKEARLSLIPAGPLWELAVLYGRGQEKYPDHVAGAPNWKRGYEWSKSADSVLRHWDLFWMGEDHDPEMGVKHVICVAWHALNMAWMMENRAQYDDRPTSVEPERYLGALPTPQWLVEKRRALAVQAERESLKQAS